MNNKLLLGLWQREVARQARGAVKSLGFMSEDHHRVRDFAVRELPRVGKPLAPAFLAQELDLSLARTVAILDELETNMTFLYRDDGESVTWAYPVTVDLRVERFGWRGARLAGKHSYRRTVEVAALARGCVWVVGDGDAGARPSG